MKETATLQDIEAWIKMVKDGKKSRVTRFLNRFALPYVVYKGWSDNEWLKVLYFERRQETEKIKFYEKFEKTRKARKLVE